MALPFMSLSLSCWAADILLAGWKDAAEGFSPGGGARPGGGATPAPTGRPEKPVGVGVSVAGPRSNRM